MNLELLDPFGRQVPDRVDATIQLADLLHRPASQREQSDVIHPKDSYMDDINQTKAEHITSAHKGDADASEYRAAFHVAYNRRGTYLAVGHASGTVAVHETQTRTLVALYHGDTSTVGSDSKPQNTSRNGCSSLSWSRRSRALLTGSTGDVTVRLYDTTHPLGPEEASTGLLFVSGTAAAVEDDADGDGVVAASPSQATHPTSSSQRAALHNTTTVHNSLVTDEVLPVHSVFQTQHTPFADADRRIVHLTEGRTISTQAATLGSKVLVGTKRRKDQTGAVIVEPPDVSSPVKKYPSVAFDFPHAVAGSLQINPCRPNAGLAVLANGTLVLFWIPPDAFIQKKAPVAESTSTQSSSIVEPRCVIVPLTHDPGASVTAMDATPSSSGATSTTTTSSSSNNNRTFACAAFDPRGTKVYAVHKSGVLLGYNVAPIWKTLSDAANKSKRLPLCEPKFTWSLSGNGGGSGGGSASVDIWHLMISRNGKFLILNSSNGSIRLYTTPQECWQGGDHCNDKKPAFVFQDVVNRVKFASCDLSGDGEYVVGGANGNNNKYELYIWNTSTGALMDTLTGASTKLYSVAWHPTRSFLAVACADGLVDVWGPRINWTAFAPDFQALPMNVEYIEREDEFDIPVVQTTPGSNSSVDEQQKDQVGGDHFTVDVTTINPVPVFASDSENEDDVFVFETRVKNLLAGRAERASRKSGVGVDD